MLDVRSVCRRLPALILLSAAGAAVGAAASMGLSPSTMGAGWVAAPRCTVAGLSVVQNLSAGSVASVTVSGLPATCGSASLLATVHNGVTSGSGSATVPAGGGSLTVPLAVTPSVTAVEQTDIVLVGP